MSVPINWSAMPSWAVDAMVTNDYRGVILTNGDKRYCPIDEPEEFSTPCKDYDGVMSKSPIVSVREVKMSEAKFTKGEWEIVCSDDETFMRSVCQVSGDCFINSNQKLSENLLADANLIAAAPDMYHELQRDINRINKILSEFSGITNRPLIAERNRKVLLLAKARGEV